MKEQAEIDVAPLVNSVGVVIGALVSQLEAAGSLEKGAFGRAMALLPEVMARTPDLKMESRTVERQIIGALAEMLGDGSVPQKPRWTPKIIIGGKQE